MNNKDVLILMELAKEIGLTQAKVAAQLGYTDNYWFKVRTGRAPLTAEILTEIKKLRKKLEAFAAA